MFLSNLAQGTCREPLLSSFARALPSRMPSLPNRRASWKGQKPPLPRNFGTRPLHPNIIWHSIKGKGERIRREEEEEARAWPQLCLALPPSPLSVSVSSWRPPWSVVPVIIWSGRWAGRPLSLSAGQQSRRRRWRAWRWHAIVARLTRSHSHVRTDQRTPSPRTRRRPHSGLVSIDVLCFSDNVCETRCVWPHIRIWNPLIAVRSSARTKVGPIYAFP